MALLRAEVLPVDWVDYCVLPSAQQLVWEERGNDLTKLMIFLMNSKNDNTKKDLCLTYSKGNKTAYPLSIKAMTRYMSTQYPNKNSGHQRKGKKGDINRKKGDGPKSEDKDNNATSTTGAHVEDYTTPEISAAPSRRGEGGAFWKP